MKVLMIGCGAVGHAVLAYWKRVLPSFVPDEIVVIEPRNVTVTKEMPVFRWIRKAITKDDYAETVVREKPDLVVDLSIGIDSEDLIDLCLERNILYVNTAQEDWVGAPAWDPEPTPKQIRFDQIGSKKTDRRVGAEAKMYDHSLRKKQIELLDKNKGRKRATAVLDHGMNPGLISHFAKLALERMASEELSEEIASGLLSLEDHASLARRLGVRTIHVSENDTQETDLEKADNVFMNTWSAIGFMEEATDPTQIGRGSHEQKPGPASLRDETGRAVSACDVDELRLYNARGMNVLVKSYEPVGGPFEGHCISHGENTSLCRYLTVPSQLPAMRIDVSNMNKEEFEKLVATYGEYRPSVYYVYSPAPCAQESLEELKRRRYEFQDYYYILKKNDVVSGVDSVGVLLLRDPSKGKEQRKGKGKGNGKDGSRRAFWAGTILGNDGVDEITNATCVQVACGVLSAVDYAATHPREGVVFAEHLDSHRVADISFPFLGEVRFEYVDVDLPTSFEELVSNVSGE